MRRPHLSGPKYASQKRSGLKTQFSIHERLNGGSANGGLRPLCAICAQSSTIVHFCGFSGPLSKGIFRHEMTTIVGNRGQLWTSALSPHWQSPHLDFPDQYTIFVLEFAGPLVSKRGFDPQYVSVFDRYAASTCNLLDMFRFSFNTKFGKDKKPIKIRPATQNTQRIEISIRNATWRKRSGSGLLRARFSEQFLEWLPELWEATWSGKNKPGFF